MPEPVSERDWDSILFRRRSKGKAGLLLTPSGEHGLMTFGILEKDGHRHVIVRKEKRRKTGTRLTGLGGGFLPSIVSTEKVDWKSVHSPLGDEEVVNPRVQNR